ncbi:hypothetical protein NG895_12595 [Aeoliella sp. ICT_H6.2]|uniref:Carboxypeptidase regulatory-like domain-containing protein n=1 Tax=Aeoliella straminimaris TaxID=2954799 RepID=A0A9X2FAP9_9BACT|nr:hypothetical protein [Aeoliella straminimaris]MCO6044748.1 hypothetical protein [Aeoliella straminimaris]
MTPRIPLVASQIAPRFAFLISSLLLVAGCDSGPDTAQVSGLIVFDGEKVPKGTISFYPVGGGRPASGQIQSDGTYKLSTFDPGDGALLGEHKVAIESKEVSGNAPKPKSLKEEVANPGASAVSNTTVTWIVPEKYAAVATSELTATVSEGDNKIDFNLP